MYIILKYLHLRYICVNTVICIIFVSSNIYIKDIKIGLGFVFLVF